MRFKIGFFLLILLGLQTPLLAQGFLFFKGEELKQLKSAAHEQSLYLKPYTKMLRKAAEKMLRKGPWSVTDYPSPAVSGNPHDYFSESPYWWPDPENPSGPYIRKDGLRNPQRFMAHKNALKSMIHSVSILSFAAWLFDKAAYARQAQKVLQVWFLDEETKMNPHLDYAQAIRNKSPGRGVGIIDTHRFIFLLEYLNFLQASGYWNEGQRVELQQWFKQYLYWLNHSKNGLHEKHQGNNHTSWWCAQVAAGSFFTQDKALRDSLWAYVKNTVIEMQFEADGRMPAELARTKSFDYCEFNLNALSLLSRMAQKDGQLLWIYENSKGGSLKKAIDFMVPYWKDPQGWPYQQILPHKSRSTLILYLAAEAMPNAGYGDLMPAAQIGPDELNNYSGDLFAFFLNMIRSTTRR